MERDNSGSAFDRSETEGHIEMAILRDNAGRPTKEEVNKFINNFAGKKLISTYEEEIKNDKYFNEILDFRSDLEKLKGRGVSRPYLCAAFLMTSAGADYSDLAEYYAKNENTKAEFRFYHDFAFGFQCSLLGVYQAEEELWDKSKNMMVEEVFYVGDRFNSSEDEKTACCDWLSKHSVRSLKILIEDPSGISLVRSYMTRSIEEDQNVFSELEMAPEYMSMGAEAAGNLYEILYNKMELM